ncbi:MAG: hypothetical protein VKJ04_11960 [Vampirovibrionales bacterium]|nr:hypothetical protein [Vampirovibrionales bacterium]
MSHQQQAVGLIHWVSAIALVLVLAFGASHVKFSPDGPSHSDLSSILQMRGLDLSGTDVSGSYG